MWHGWEGGGNGSAIATVPVLHRLDGWSSLWALWDGVRQTRSGSAWGRMGPFLPQETQD